MHGVPGAKHAFLEAGSHGEISFVEFAAPVEGTPGVSYPAKNSAPSPITTLHHMAYRAESLKQLYAIREQVKSAGARPSRVIDHKCVLLSLAARRARALIPACACAKFHPQLLLLRPQRLPSRSDVHHPRIHG